MNSSEILTQTATVAPVEQRGEAADAPRPQLRPHGFVRTWTEVWSHRELLRILAIRDLRIRYKSSVLGLVWSALNPLVVSAVYWAMLKFFFPNALVDRYIVYLLLGMVLWTFFTMAVQGAAVSLIGNAGIVSKVAFPRQIVPLATVLNTAINAMIAFALTIPFLVATQSWPSWWTLQAIPVMLLFVVFIAGLALFLAAATVFFRDIEHLLGVILFPLYFATPILWADFQFGLTGTKAKILFFGNPVTPFISGFRECFYSPHVLGVGSWLFMLMAAGASLALGTFVFARYYDELPSEL